MLTQKMSDGSESSSSFGEWRQFSESPDIETTQFVSYERLYKEPLQSDANWLEKYWNKLTYCCKILVSPFYLLQTEINKLIINSGLLKKQPILHIWSLKRDTLALRLYRLSFQHYIPLFWFNNVGFRLRLLDSVSLMLTKFKEFNNVAVRSLKLSNDELHEHLLEHLVSVNEQLKTTSHSFEFSTSKYSLICQKLEINEIQGTKTLKDWLRKTQNSMKSLLVQLVSIDDPNAWFSILPLINQVSSIVASLEDDLEQFMRTMNKMNHQDPDRGLEKHQQVTDSKKYPAIDFASKKDQEEVIKYMRKLLQRTADHLDSTPEQANQDISEFNVTWRYYLETYKPSLIFIDPSEKNSGSYYLSEFNEDMYPHKSTATSSCTSTSASTKTLTTRKFALELEETLKDQLMS